MPPLLNSGICSHCRESEYYWLTPAGHTFRGQDIDKYRLTPRQTVPAGSALPTQAHTLGKFMAAGRGGLCIRPWTRQTPMAIHRPTSDPPRLVFPPPRLTRERHTPSVASYFASIDTTLKELDAELTQSRLITPYIDRVTRILERLEQREAREACPVAPAPPPHAEHSTRPAARSVPAPPVWERDTLHRYFRDNTRETYSPPSSERRYHEEDNTPGERETAPPACQYAPPTGPPRKWFDTAAGDWIDLDKLNPVDWDVASANLANSVALLSPPVRENHKVREEDMSAQPHNEPPADIFIKVDDAKPKQDMAWYASGDTNTMCIPAGTTNTMCIPAGTTNTMCIPAETTNTMCTTGDSRMVEQFFEVPQLVGRTEGGLRAAPPSSTPTYNWRTDTGRGHSAHPFGSPQDGDTYTSTTQWEGVTFCSPRIC